jgi:DNA-binding HxlR family transcriptional regulator
MPGRSLPEAREKDEAPPAGGDKGVLDEAFRRFRHSATAFSGSLSEGADFRSAVNGAPVAQMNLQVARSIFGKWSLDILVLLVTEREMGFGELRKALRGISSRILSAKLKQLESRGLIRREVLATRPPRVNYGLTERGLTVTRLGEPVLLYLRFVEGLYVQLDGSRDPASGLAVPSPPPP